MECFFVPHASVAFWPEKKRIIRRPNGYTRHFFKKIDGFPLLKPLAFVYFKLQMVRRCRAHQLFPVPASLASWCAHTMLDTITSIRWQDVCDILIVAYLIYRVILLIKGTRAVQMLVGIAVLMVVYFGARELEFLTLYWLLGSFLSSIFLIVIIIFQRDIRRALTQVGRTPFSKADEETVHTLSEIVKASLIMSHRKIGGLIAIERETGLKDFIESGQFIDSAISRQLIISLFLPESPLHDGAVVVSNGRIVAAGCVLPLTKNPYISKQLGTRHRAAIGLSEETDAVVIVISEETQKISLVQHGAITSDLDENGLRARLDAIFLTRDYPTPLLWKNWLNR